MATSILTKCQSLSSSSLIAYLCFMGLLASMAMALAALLFVAYLLQLLLESIISLAHTFGCLPPSVQLLSILFVFMLVAWFFSRKGKVQYGQQH